MTIVLQHQYWDLVIGEESFEVTVSFNKQQERIKVPFAALVGLRRSLGALRPAVRPQGQGGAGDKPDAASPVQAPARPAGAREAPGARSSAPDEAKPEEATRRGASPRIAASKIVKLDSFRKK